MLYHYHICGRPPENFHWTGKLEELLQIHFSNLYIRMMPILMLKIRKFEFFLFSCFLLYVNFTTGLEPPFSHKMQACALLVRARAGILAGETCQLPRSGKCRRLQGSPGLDAPAYPERESDSRAVLERPEHSQPGSTVPACQQRNEPWKPGTSFFTIHLILY